MRTPLRLAKEDAFAVFALLGTSVVIALPILRGGYFTYVDNSVHLAEIYELARSHGDWTEIGFAGFALGTLHSPLWYPLLAAVVRLGVPLEPVYAALLLLSFAAPSLALYFCTRARCGSFRAALVAYLLLVQPQVTWGIGSPLGGMWTHALAAAGFTILAELWTRDTLTLVQQFVAAAVLALVLVTHSFAWPAVALLALIVVVQGRRARTLSDDELGKRAVGAAIAAAAAAKYWLTFLMSADPEAAPIQRLRPSELLARLLLPADPMYLTDGRLRESIRWDLHLTDAIPAFSLVGLGVYGFFRRRAPKDTFARTGFWLATSMLACLVVHRYVKLPFLGPVAWRLLSWVDTGFAWSAVAGVSALPLERVPSLARRFGAPVLALSSAALGFWWGLPLRHEADSNFDVERAHLERLWAWLRKNARPEWGRVYLHDTFGYGWDGPGLAHSHVLALTSHYANTLQIGTYYGVVPYRLRWTLSEFDTFFGSWSPSRDWVLEAMGKVNASVLVVSNDEMKQWLLRTGVCDVLYEVARYAVLRVRGLENRFVAELTPSNHAGPVRFELGSIEFPLDAGYPRTRVLVKTGYHPWWRLDGIPGAMLRESPEGFLVIDRIPAGHFEVRLRYEPSAIPGAVSAAGISALLGWAALLFAPRLRRRREAATVAPSVPGRAS
jgi:hypothetical protein